MASKLLGTKVDQRRALRLVAAVSLLAAGVGVGSGGCSKGTDTSLVDNGTGGEAAGAGGSAVSSGGATSSSTHGTTTSATTASVASTGSGGGGPPGPCVTKADCTGVEDACNAGNCVNGMCEKAPANEGAACDDGMYCTDNDACSAGMCVGGTMKFCPSPDSCHVGQCDEATQSCGSAPGNDGASCDDGDPCTYSGTCGGGTCSKGAPVDCSNFSSVCGDGVCDPVLGCMAKPKNNGSACDDMLFCTVNDTCTNGACSGVPNTCAPPGDVCLVGVCNEASKSCVAQPGNNGMACDDKSACTTGETCSNGTCGGGAPANNGGSCDDQQACTANDKCSAGVCAGMSIVACVDNDGCCAPGCSLATDNDCKVLAHNIVDPQGNAFMSGWGSGILHKISNGVVSTVANNAPTGGFSMAFSPTNGTLYAITPGGSPTTVYTVNTVTGMFTSWANVGVQLGDAIDGMWFDPSGNMYINQGGATKVWKVSPQAVVTTFFTGAPVNNNITQGTCDSAGNVYVPSRSLPQIVELSPAAAVVQTLTTSCPPWGIAAMPSGKIAYTCDSNTVYELDPVTKISTTFATPGGTGLAFLSVDVQGNVWVGQWSQSTAYELSPAGATLWSGTISGGSGAAF